MYAEKQLISAALKMELRTPGLLSRLSDQQSKLRAVHALELERLQSNQRLSNQAMLEVFAFEKPWGKSVLPEQLQQRIAPAISFDLTNLPKQNAKRKKATEQHADNRSVIIPSNNQIQRVIVPSEEPTQKNEIAQQMASNNLPNARRINTRGNALAPMAFIEFCTKNKSHCAISGNKEVNLTSASLGILKRVNREINRSIKPRSEQRDVWKVNVKSGDCEDFALTKRAKLIKHGFPASALRMAVARTPFGEGHAVLVVSTNRGDFVLDNRHNDIRSFHRTDLAWVKIQGKENPMLWSQI